MKINIIGGGPAGLYFAILMKKAGVSHEIDIYERNGPDDTFGWGVVFSGKTLANLRAADQESHAEITKQFEAWDNVDVVHRNEKVSIHGNSFSGTSYWEAYGYFANYGSSGSGVNGYTNVRPSTWANRGRCYHARTAPTPSPPRRRVRVGGLPPM